MQEVPLVFVHPLSSRRHGHIDEHIFKEDAVSRGGIVDQDVGDGSDKLAVLNDGRAAHECGQEGTTNFNGIFIKFIILG